MARWRTNQTGDAQTAAAVTTMAYDLTGHLSAIDAAGTANDAAFTLDALGRFRTRVLVSGGTDTYSYIDTSEVVTRIANSGGTTTDSIVSPTGDRLGVKVGATLNWFLPDLHGDIAASLDSTEATVVNAIRYDAYGQTIATGTAGGTKVGADTWKYQGRLDISPAGLGTPLYDMSARFYNPGIGAFTQFDSVKGKAQNPLSMHRFLYAAANPATLIDPTGHTVCSAANEDCVYQRQNELRVDKVQSLARKRSATARERSAGGRVATRRAPSASRQPGSMSWRVKYGAAVADWNSHLTPRDELAEAAREAGPGDSWTHHDVLNAFGLIPGFGTPFDLSNAASYASEGDFGNAALRAAAVLPIFDLLKVGRKAGPEVVDAAAMMAKVSEPGKWAQVSERFSDRAAAYQAYATKSSVKAEGTAMGEAYVVNGRKFDGWDPDLGALIDAKGARYDYLLDKGFGVNGIIKQAKGQVRDAPGIPIIWRVAEPGAATKMTQILQESGVTGISVVYWPMP